MYNICLLGTGIQAEGLFSDKYEVTDDITQANVILTDGYEITDEMLQSRLAFAVADLSENGLDQKSIDACSARGTVVFRSENGPEDTAACVCDYIENGNVRSSVNFPDVDLGPFGDDVSRISVLCRGLDNPVLLGAMMFSEMDLKAVAGGIRGGLGCALVSAREQVTGVPHVDGVLKVRVLQDI